ncbi:MAG: IPT/TIG domain-containing protein [Myxococcota bacterium]
MIRRFAPVLALALTLLGCPPSSSNTDGGGAYPIVTSVMPASGPLTGGTLVTVNGVNFFQGSTVKFDDVLGSEVTFVSSSRLTVKSPAVTNPGTSAVTVTNPDGKSGSLPDAFTFQPVTTLTIAEAKLLNSASQADTSGAAMVSATIAALVEVPTVTPGLGQGLGVRAQVGWATSVSSPPVSADFTWSAATYRGDIDGIMPGAFAADDYVGTVSLPGATGAPVTYVLAARFSVDDGATWTLADRDGLANGLQAEQLARLTVSKPSIDWCKLGGETIEAPPSLMLRTGATGPIVYGQVYKQGVTDGAGAGSQVKGQLGVGLSGVPLANWAWVDATFNRDSGNGANDEFQAALTLPSPGTYKFAFRFNHADGDWAYCDADGLATGGFTEDQAGSLTVSAQAIDRCVLQFPATLMTVQGQPSALVYGRVFSSGLTDPPGQASAIDAELGFGPAADAPSMPSWTWTAQTAFNVDVAGGGEEYQARVTGPTPGSYAYGWRFRLSGGAWVYCDLDGSENGFQAGQAGVLTATAPGTAISACRLQSVSAFSTMSGGPVTAAVRVVIPGVSGNAGPSPNLKVQLGVGTQGTNASASALWGWGDATFSSDQPMQEEEWALTFHPAYTGNRAVAGRASLDDGGTWTYCDLNGSDVGGYEVNQQYDVQVTPHSELDWCNLQSPLTGPVGTTVYGRVYESGVTPNPAAAITAQLGIGVESEDPGIAWRWSSASFNVTVGNDNEYQATLPDAGVGTRYAFRFTLDGGSYCFGDSNGSTTGGFTGGSTIGEVTP